MRGILVLGSLLFCGCTGLVENGGRVLDGSAFAEKTLAVYQTLGGDLGGVEVKRLSAKKPEQETLSITLPDFPNLVFRGTLPAEDGGFELKSMRFIGGSVSGWNEFTLDLTGTGNFSFQGDLGTFQIERIEAGEISSGKIRLKGSRLIGDQALASLRNRRQRIDAVTGWMLTQKENPVFETQKDFEAYWKPRLLPEIVSPGKRPEAFAKAKENARWVRAEDVRWNRSYTEVLLPEDLWTIRNSGALLRDWEEAGTWIYVQYQWGHIAERISNRYTVIKIK